MNHPLAVYTAIYLAVLFVTVSIWGSNISTAAGDLRILLAAQGAFSLKLAIDDYVHFHAVRGRVHVDLHLSLLIYLLLASSVAASATGRGQLASLAFGAMFVVGIVWLFLSGFSGRGKRRRIAWLIINVLSAGLLGWAAVLVPASSYTLAAWPLGLLLMLVVIDFFCLGTLRRLARLAEAADHAQAPGQVEERGPVNPAVGSPGAIAGDPAPTTAPAAAAAPNEAAGGVKPAPPAQAGAGYEGR